ncbi:DDE-type integrase/transposase/recombinase [Catenovulum sediminis]|uniref:DDE-type integrase/transposase/recombinase n=1 Tax=Catenovulum sediminis TaxID=1740262 RepID=UPI00117F86DE|nr:DDE-type integrase/transposase/recombinase [Catenovulum sediminis]
MTQLKANKPPLEIRLQVLSAVDYAKGATIKARIQDVATRTFVDKQTNIHYQFTWRTISTWVYRFKKHGVTTLDNKTRIDKNHYRKVQPNELAEAIHEVLPTLGRSKNGHVPKMALYRRLLANGLFKRSQLSQTSFYRMVSTHGLLDSEQCQKLRQSFAMQFSNELWQADTMHGIRVKDEQGNLRKTFLIAFIDDASRLIIHAEFFYADNTTNMCDAFRTALFKRGKPERLYFDNGSNYSSKEILQACVRLDIHLSHAPIRDGAAKGKIERFFRRFRDQFLVDNPNITSLDELNDKTNEWVEHCYNSQFHSGIQMTPLDRFCLDLNRIQFIADDEFTEEVFFVEQDRKVSKTNVFSIHKQQFECPVDLRGKTIQVRFNRSALDKFIVYYQDKRMGQASCLDLHANAIRHMRGDA